MENQLRSLSGLQTKVVYFSWAACGFALLSSIFTVAEIFAFRDLDGSTAYSWDVEYLDPGLVPSSDASIILYVITFLIAAFLSLRWIYLANANAQLLSPEVPVTPGWNVGWFFVPIATWWKPYEGVRAVWRVSRNPEAPAQMETPGFLGSWWAFWLLTNIAGTIAFRLELNAETISTAIASDLFDVASSIAVVPATYYFLKVVRDITAAQEEWVRA